MSFTFQHRKRDNKGAGKVRLEDDNTESISGGGMKKSHIFIGVGALAVAGLVAAFLMVSGDDDHVVNNTEVVDGGPTETVTRPTRERETVIKPPVTNEPVIVVQSTSERMQEKVNTIPDRSSCLYEAFVSSSNYEVRAGSDFSYFACLYDEGGMGVLIADGEWAGTRVVFQPREAGDGKVSVEVVGKAETGQDRRTVEYHRLPRSEWQVFSSPMAGRDITQGDGVHISQTAGKFTKTVSQGGQMAKAFIIAGNLVSGVFEVEIANGDVYQINLNTGDFYADSLFQNCPAYRYGDEDLCQRESFEPVKGVLPRLDTLQR